MFGLKQIFASLFRLKRSYSSDWSKLRNNYIKEHPYCAICGYYSYTNDVHHIKPKHLFPEEKLDENNLITLCRKYSCHLRFGHFGNYSKYYNPDIRAMSNIGSLMIQSETKAKENI